MIPVLLKRGLLAFSTLLLLNCRTSQLAYVQPTRTQWAPPASAAPLPAAQAEWPPAGAAGAVPAVAVAAAPPPEVADETPPYRHQNPDAAPARRRTLWQQVHLHEPSGDNYTAPRFIATVETKRHVPKGAIYALAAGVLPYGLFLVSNLPGWAWWISLALPVASLFMAAGTLAKIRHNRQQFRGRGWAVAAMLLATSYLGMVLYAVAALVTSGVLWE